MSDPEVGRYLLHYPPMDPMTPPASGADGLVGGGDDHVRGLDDRDHAAALGQAELPDRLHGDRGHHANPVGVEFDVDDGLAGLDGGNGGRDLVARAELHDMLP